MEIFSRNLGKVIGSAPQLDTVLMVEEFIEKHSGDYTPGELFRNLPKKMLWRTFKIILAYLENLNKIVINKDNTITWVWNPALVKKYLSKKSLEVKF